MSEHPGYFVIGDRVVLDGDVEECGEVTGEEMNGVVVRWDGGDYTIIAVNDLLPEKSSRTDEDLSGKPQGESRKGEG